MYSARLRGMTGREWWENEQREQWEKERVCSGVCVHVHGRRNLCLRDSMCVYAMCITVPMCVYASASGRWWRRLCPSCWNMSWVSKDWGTPVPLTQDDCSCQNTVAFSQRRPKPQSALRERKEYVAKENLIEPVWSLMLRLTFRPECTATKNTPLGCPQTISWLCVH